ncbi:uncharacterized protein DUF3793 [Hydrogenispora ethanolica]|uniref:Uncharacterized protein DUF3793 n=2 Tax=Hydrogenispora ethanolica TaxID=1082276 RepID=A0A4R1SD62_HYDET|nr:uncharacterized protein DUF3793 [Hydrogenispora ethanolica]
MKEGFTGTGAKDMRKDLEIRYLQNWKHLRNEEYVLHAVAYHGAPVLKGYKPAVIVTFANDRRRLLRDAWREHRTLIPWTADFRYEELYQTAAQTAVLLYHPGLLREVLVNRQVALFLETLGYRKELTVEGALADLKEHYRTGCPHEIGLFLGIPLPDVLGFIHHGGKRALADGYWKVYHDPGRKQALFALFYEAKLEFIRLMLAGNPPGDYLSGKASRLADAAAG